jgi:hypothetical protein
MHLRPNHFDDLRILAKALARRRRETPSPEHSSPAVRRPDAGHALILVATVMAVGALFVPRAWLPCLLLDCSTALPRTVTTIPDTVAVAIAPPAGTPAADDHPRAVAVTPESTPDADLAPTTDLAPTVELAPTAERSVPPTPARRARAAKPAIALAPRASATPDAGTSPNISGRWMITNAIEATSRDEFAGLRIRFRIQLEQRGDRITGRGVKFSVNDEPVPRRQQSRIILAGTVHGRDAVVRFVEHGTRRTSTGGFHWRVSPDGTRLQGTFDSAAANTRGRSQASRDD